MKRDWIVSIACLGIFSVVLVLLSQVSHSQIRNCKSPDGSQPCITNNNAHFNNGNNTDARLRILTQVVTTYTRSRILRVQISAAGILVTAPAQMIQMQLIQTRNQECSLLGLMSVLIRLV